MIVLKKGDSHRFSRRTRVGHNGVPRARIGWQSPFFARPHCCRLCISLLLAGLLACQPASDSGTYSGSPGAPIGLPDGTTIQAELAVTDEQVARGLMFRTQLAADGGMLFVFTGVQPRSFYMFQTLIALDIIWIDAGRRIVYISRDTPPCPSRNPSQCPTYGEGTPAQYVLELAGGQATAHGLKVGDRLTF